MFKSTFGGSSSYSAHYIYGSMTNGTPYWAQRIEAANVTDLNNKTVTVSGLLYQDTGSTQSFSARLARSGTLDNWSGTVTSIAASANISVPSGVVTPFSATFTLGATDATNGLMAEVFTSSTVTCTNKNFALSDWQLELGSVKTPFEMRPIGVELALCQRYYQNYPSGSVPQVYVNGSSVVGSLTLQYKVSMRATPTSTSVGTGAVQVSSSESITVYQLGITNAWYNPAPITASAEL
jgi:beta-glucanase (GH16 family)